MRWLLHYVHEVIYGMGRGLLQPERDAKISKYLTTMSRNIQPKFEQQIRADFNRVASKPMPKVNNLDKLHQDQVENILELAVRTAYLEHITRLINNPSLKTNSVSLVNEGCYVSRTYLNSSSFKYNNLSSRLKNNAFHPYSAWMRFFKGSESGPHTLIPTPSVKHVEKH